MTYEAPPPPPAASGSAGTSPADTFKSLNRLDQVVLAGGLLTFILSLFLPWYGVKVKGAEGFPGGSSSITAWHSYDVLALLLLLAATVLAGARVFAGSSLPQIAVGYRWITAALAALGALLYILRSFTLKHGGDFGFSYGLRWGAYVLLILILATAVAAVMSALQSDEAKPWAGHSGGTGAPGASGWGASQPPPPAGTTPPPAGGTAPPPPPPTV